MNLLFMVDELSLVLSSSILNAPIENITLIDEDGDELATSIANSEGKIDYYFDYEIEAGDSVEIEVVADFPTYEFMALSFAVETVEGLNVESGNTIEVTGEANGNTLYME